ncbi:chemotaxis protein CheD [Natronomonas sp. F2-12]|uniref:Probable chemoreceptor glutamine deamidase CheD n=1 Tax=Natronomonas aquatica TaxID=2841590 RepID=A0A9R1CQW1_9EURY|nr:chemotaxis protein CheD [Natronomonas aquatica]
MARLVEGRAGLTDRVKISIADHAVGSEGLLTTSGLGSCLGVVIYHPERGISGLVHPMLPRRNEAESRPAERFVDSGIELLVEELLAAGADESALRAKITGGAAVVDFGNDDESIGDRNVAVARTVLADRGIEVVAEEVGGDCGRTVHVDAETGTVTVKRTDGVETEL